MSPRLAHNKRSLYRLSQSLFLSASSALVYFFFLLLDCRGRDAEADVHGEVVLGWSVYFAWAAPFLSRSLRGIRRREKGLAHTAEDRVGDEEVL